MSANGHQWRCFTAYDVTPEDADRIVSPRPGQATEPREFASDDPPPIDDPTPYLGLHNLVRELVHVGCFRCEQPYSAGLAARQCLGDPDSYAPGGAPLWGGRPHPPVPDAPEVRIRGVGRNDPCPCGSGKKFKRCCGG